MRIAIIIGWLLLFVACGQPKGDQQKQNSQRRGDVHFKKLEQRLDSLKDNTVMPGFGVVIVAGDSLAYGKGFGVADLEKQTPFTPNTIHVIASVSKTFIGTALVKLMEMKGIELDTPVNHLLPFEVRNPHFPDSVITLRQLTNHTAGFREDFDPETIGQSDVLLLESIEFDNDSVFEIVKDDMKYYELGRPTSLRKNVYNFLHPKGDWYSDSNFRRVPPGHEYEYSNLNADLAAYIIEYQSGMAFSAFTEKYIFKPLGMAKTSWFYQPESDLPYSTLYRPNDWENPNYAIQQPKFRYAGYSSGDLKSTLLDMSYYIKEMLRGAHGKGILLSQKGYEMIFSPQLHENHFPNGRDDSVLSDEYNSGIFWAVSPSNIYLHNGGSIGVYSFLYVDSATNSGAFGFSNLADPHFEFVRNYVFEAANKYVQK